MTQGFFSIYEVGIQAYTCVNVRIGDTFIKYMQIHHDGSQVYVVYHLKHRWLYQEYCILNQNKWSKHKYEQGLYNHIV